MHRLPRRRRSNPPEFRPGLPDGLPDDVFRHVVVGETGVPATDVYHQHLSGWKRAGAYRLVITTRAGQTSLVFKDARYSRDHIAALDGLPIRPGPPELAVYRCDDPALKGWVPRALWAYEQSSGDRYRYLVEDLASDFDRPAGPQALAALCAQLPMFHRKLNTALSENTELVRYDGDFHERLVEYASAALHRYAREADQSTVAVLADRWKRVDVELRRALDEAYRRLDPQPVHGDLNLANVLTARDGSGELRLLDWEWAGHGLPHLDLAAALKAADRRLERRALTAYHRNVDPRRETFEQLWRTFHACKLLRALLDSSFLARQHLDGPPASRVDVARYVRSSVIRAGSALDELERAAPHAGE